MPAAEPPHVAGGRGRQPLAAMLRRAGLDAPNWEGGMRLFSAPIFFFGGGGQRGDWKDSARVWVARAL